MFVGDRDGTQVWLDQAGMSRVGVANARVLMMPAGVHLLQGDEAHTDLQAKSSLSRLVELGQLVANP